MFFLELSCFFDDPANISNFISGSSAFSKNSLNIWKFIVHILLKPGLENFEHYFTSVWDKGTCAVVWAFFGIGMKGEKQKTKTGLWVLLSKGSLYNAHRSQYSGSGFSFFNWRIITILRWFLPYIGMNQPQAQPRLLPLKPPSPSCCC